MDAIHEIFWHCTLRTALNTDIINSANYKRTIKCSMENNNFTSTNSQLKLRPIQLRELIDCVSFFIPKLNYAPKHCLCVKPGLVPESYPQRSSAVIGNTKVETLQTDTFLTQSTMQIMFSMRKAEPAVF